MEVQDNELVVTPEHVIEVLKIHHPLELQHAIALASNQVLVKALHETQSVSDSRLATIEAMAQNLDSQGQPVDTVVVPEPEDDESEAGHDGTPDKKETSK